MKKADIFKINDTTYRFTELGMGTEVYIYLLIGTDKALLIDTGYGLTDIPAAIRGLTELPLIVVNTHGHFDHTHGNGMYSEIFIAEEDIPVYIQHSDPDYLRPVLTEMAKWNNLDAETAKDIELICDCAPVPVKPLPEEMFFELGGRRVELIKSPGHTPGSISLYDVNNRFLFTADTTCRDGVLLMFPESCSVACYRRSLAEIRSMVGNGLVERIYPSHQETPVGFDVLDDYEKGCSVILSEAPPQELMQAGFIKINRTAIRFDRERLH